MYDFIDHMMNGKSLRQWEVTLHHIAVSIRSVMTCRNRIKKKHTEKPWATFTHLKMHLKVENLIQVHVCLYSEIGYPLLVDDFMITTVWIF